MSNSSSNIKIDGLSSSGFNLPNGYSWDLQLENGKKEGITIVRNKFKLLHAKLEFHNDKLNGLCQFFKNGSIYKKITYKNNVADGWSCDCLRGKEVKWFIYKDGVKSVELIPCDEKEGFWKEIDLSTNSLISICQYNENHLKHGRGYLYVDNHISKVVGYADGNIYVVYQEFDDTTKVEYDNKGNKIYEGGYEDNFLLDYPRYGEGVAFENDIVVYSGEWKNGLRDGCGNSMKNDMVYYEGDWKEDVPDGEGVLYDEDGNEKYYGEWKKGIYRINDSEYFNYTKGIIESLQLIRVKIQSSNALSRLSRNDELIRTVNEIVIDEECGNELTEDYMFSNFDNLKSIVIKKRSFLKLTSFSIKNNTQLNSIVIEDGEKEWDSEKKTRYTSLEIIKSFVLSGTFILFYISNE